MKYDFDTVVDRRGTGSLKWDLGPGKWGDSSVLPLWVADMDFPVAPEITEALKRRTDHPVYGYTIREESYYWSVIGWMKSRHGWTVERDWIVCTPGVVPALNMAVLAFSEPGEGVVVQTPVYYPFSLAVIRNKRKLVINRLGMIDCGEEGRSERRPGESPGAVHPGNETAACPYTMDLAGLRSVIGPDTKLLILSNPHNPVGRVWRPEDLAALAGICAERGIIVISDEIHGDLVMPGYRHTVFTEVSSAAREIGVVCTAPSKTFNLAGLSTSNIVIPNPALRERFDAEVQSLGLGLSNTFGITACEAAYRFGAPWLDALLPYLWENFRTLVSFARARLPWMNVLPLEGTYLAWLDCAKLGLSDSELVDFFGRKARVWCDEGVKFGSGGEGFMRMNIACPRSTLVEALERLERAASAGSRQPGVYCIEKRERSSQES